MRVSQPLFSSLAGGYYSNCKLFPSITIRAGVPPPKRCAMFRRRLRDSDVGAGTSLLFRKVMMSIDMSAGGHPVSTAHWDVADNGR